MANGWQALVETPPQQQKRRGGSIFEALREAPKERAARRITTPPPPPFQSPDDVLRTLDHWTKRIYGGSSFLKLKNPFSRLVVNLAAFHPGAQYLVEKYGPEVLKSKRVVEHITGAHEAPFPPRGVQVGKKYVSFLDLVRARGRGYSLAWTEKALDLLRAAGISGVWRLGLRWAQAFMGGVLFTPPQKQLHPYTLTLSNKRKVRVLLPEDLPTGTALAGAGGELAATAPLVVASGGIAGGIIGGEGLLAGIGRGLLTGAMVGATKQAIRGAPPAEIVKGAAAEAAFFGATEPVGRLLSLPFRPVAKEVGRIIEKLPSRMVSALGEAATMAATESLMALGESLLERRVPSAKEVLLRMAWTGALGLLVGGLGRIEKVEDLAKLMQKAEQNYRKWLKLGGIEDERIIEVFRDTLKREISSGRLSELARWAGQDVRRRVWTPDQVEKAAKLAFKPLPVEKPAPTQEPKQAPAQQPEQPSLPMEEAPTPAEAPAPEPPQKLTPLEQAAEELATELFERGTTFVPKTTAESRLRRQKLPAEVEVFQKEAQARLAKKYNQPIENYEHYDALLNELTQRALKEQKTEVSANWVSNQLSDPALQSKFIPHKGWRRLIFRKAEAISEKITQRLKQVKEPPQAAAPTAAPPATEAPPAETPPTEAPPAEAAPAETPPAAAPPAEAPPAEAPKRPLPKVPDPTPVEIDAPEIAKKATRTVTPTEVETPKTISEGKTDLPSLQEQLGREARFIDVFNRDEKGVWIKWKEHVFFLPKEVVPAEMKKGDRAAFLVPYNAEKIRTGEYEWKPYEVTTTEGVKRVWVLRAAGSHAEDLPSLELPSRASPPKASRSKEPSPRGFPGSASRKKGRVINPFADIIGRLFEKDIHADDTMPPGAEVDIQHIKQTWSPFIRAWLHFRSPQQVAMRASSPGLLEFFDRATETADYIQRKHISWMQAANYTLGGLRREEAELLSFALQDPNVYNALSPEMKARADALKALHEDIADVLKAHGFNVRQDFDFTHILRGDEVVTIHYIDSQGQSQTVVLGTYETIDEARIAAMNFISQQLIPQGARDFKVEITYQKNLPADSWQLFDRLPLERMLEGIERLSKQDQVAMDTYAAYMERILNDPSLIDPQSANYDPALHQAAEQLLKWLRGDIDSLPRTAIETLRSRLGLKPAPMPWWTGQRSLNLQTYERDLRIVIPSYIRSVARAVHNRAMRALEREILGKYPDMPLQEKLFLRDYRDALTGGTYAIAVMDNVLRTLKISKAERLFAYLSSLAAVKYLGLNPAKWFLNRTQPYMTTGPLVGYTRVFAALPKAHKVLRSQNVNIQGIDFTADEIMGAARLDLEDFRWMVGMERYLPELVNKATEFAMMPFTSAEAPNRVQSTIAGIDWGLSILRPWLSDAGRRAMLASGKPGALTKDERFLWARFRDKLPQWAARIEAGESVDDVLKEAALDIGRWVVDTTQFRQDVTDMPMFISKGGAFGKTLFQFMNFGVKQMEFLFGPTTPWDVKFKAAAALFAMAGLVGLPFFDELDAAVRLVTRWRTGKEFSLKRALFLRAADKRNPEHVWYKILAKGLPTLAGADWSLSIGMPLWQIFGRFGIVTEPRTAVFSMETALWQSWLRSSPGGAWIYDTIAAALEYCRTPNDITLRRLLYALLPVGVARALQAYYAHNEGVLRSTVKGKPLLKEIDAWVTVPLALGFLPERVSLIRDLTRELQREAEGRAAERQQLAARIAALVVKGWEQTLSPEESQQLNEYLQRFLELGGDTRQIEAHVNRLASTDLKQMLPSVPQKDLQNSPIMAEILQKIIQLRGE